MKLHLLFFLPVCALVRSLSVPPVALYIDITARPNLVELSQKSGCKAFKLAFALGPCDKPKWGDGEIELNDAGIMKTINDFKAIGGQLVVSTGGAMDPYLENACGTASSLAAAYKKILDAVGTDHLDIDIESTVSADKVNEALAILQRERPSTTVSYTLMILDDEYGLNDNPGLNMLKSAAAKGVRVDIVNPMAMEFWTRKTDWGLAVITAANSTVAQMKTVWPNKSDSELKKMLGVTPMIGHNFNTRVFTQDHARRLVKWATDNHIGQLSFWSVGRDNGKCPSGGVRPDCSGIQQEELEFSKIFGEFKG